MNERDKVGAQSEKAFLPPSSTTHKSQVDVDTIHAQPFNINNVFRSSQEVISGPSKKSVCDDRASSSMTISEFINGAELNSFGNFINDAPSPSLPSIMNSNNPSEGAIPPDMLDALTARVPFDHDLSELRAIITPSSSSETSTGLYDQSSSFGKGSAKDFAVPSPIRHRVSPVKLESLFTSTPDKMTTMVVNSSAMHQPLMVSRPDKLTPMAPPGQLTDTLSNNSYILSTNMRPTGTLPQGVSSSTTLSDTLQSGSYISVSQNRMYSGGKVGKKIMPDNIKEEYSVDLFSHPSTTNGESTQNLCFMSDPSVLSQIPNLAVLNNDTQKESRSFRQVDLLLSQFQSSQEADMQLPNLGANVGSDLAASLQPTVSGQSLSSTMVDQLPPSPLLPSIPTDFLDNAAPLPKSSPHQPHLHGILPNLSTTTDLALSFSTQFLENSNMSIDMGSFSGSEASFTAPHSFADSDASVAKKSELNFTNALRGVTDKAAPTKSRSPLDDTKGFLTPWKNDHRKRKCSEIIGQDPLSVVVQVGESSDTQVKSKKYVEEKPLVQQVSCFKCCVCSFLSLAKEDMADHMKTKHSQEVLVPHIKTEAEERPPDEAKKKEFAEAGTVKFPKNSAPQPTTVAQSRARRPRKDTLKKKVEPIVVSEGLSPEPTILEDPDQKAAKRRNGRVQPVRKAEDTEKNGFKCGENGCALKLKEEASLDYHRKCHVGAFLVCPECRSKFGPWSMLVMHLWKAHGIDIELHKCQLCPYKAYSYTKMMNNHWKTHSEERSFLCDNCGKGFKTAKQLRSHKVLHSSKKVETRYDCEMCTRTFSEKRMLVIHLEVVHKKVKPYLCSFCGKSFACNSTLNLHTRKHTGEKPFACDNCAYRTADHNSMRRHKMKHNNAKRYSCPYCGYSSIQSSTYKVHLKRNHEEQATKDGVLFCCSQCQFKTVKRDNYLSHMGTHHQISEEEQNRVANLQQENINNQLPTKRISSVPVSTENAVPLKQENSPGGVSSEEEPQQQTYYVVQMPHMMNLDDPNTNNEDSTRNGEVVLIQMDSSSGMVQLTPEVVAVPITSNIASNNIGGVIYVSNDVDMIDVAEMKDKT